MNLLQYIQKNVQAYVLDKADPLLLKAVAVAKTSRSTGGLYRSLSKQAQSMQTKDLEHWKAAVLMATDPENSNRLFLAQLYENLLLDNHLSSVIESRILHSQRSTYKIVDRKKNKNEDLTRLFERSWFEEFIKLVLSSRFEGTKLIEVFQTNEQGELSEINEIPSANFNAAKGLILKEPGDTTGWNYKEGVYANYYLQVGKDNELGMLAQMAPVVLAKKLGLGSWLDYVDKYGVPPLFITTEREDDKRLNELYEAAMAYKANGFIVARGNEKFAVANNTITGGEQIFNALIERVNSEISKRILGGTALTDEKAYVGSAEIQYQLAKDRFESDKLLLKNVINNRLFPLLVKLSPVYAPLQDHYFEWDNAEVMTAGKLADLVTKISPFFEMDPEYIEQITGIPILGTKQNTHESLR